MKYKIYTKTGDNGETSLWGGTRVSKNHPRIETYGTLDELNVFTGSIRDFNIDKNITKQIIWIQSKLMVISSILATDKESAMAKLPQLMTDDILQLEKYIDEFEAVLPQQTAFIIPGGNAAVSAIHKARVICRRVERQTVGLAGTINVEKNIIHFLNRLSDYFFVLARKIAQDLNAEETYWQPE